MKKNKYNYDKEYEENIENGNTTNEEINKIKKFFHKYKTDKKQIERKKANRKRKGLDYGC